MRTRPQADTGSADSADACPLDSCPPDCCAPVLQRPLDTDEAEAMADLLKVLADPIRLRLISLIASSEGAEACACDLTEPLGRSPPTVSHHLTQLVNAGILHREQRGRWAWFALREERFTAICAALQPRPDGPPALPDPTLPDPTLPDPTLPGSTLPDPSLPDPSP